MRPRFAVVFAVAVFALALFSAPANAATTITQPTGSPYAVALDSRGKPVPFTVVATGFPQFTSVFVEQCDGRSPTDPSWSPAADCDAATGQAAAVANAKGEVRFDAADPSLALRPFAGASPQQLFNCLAPGAKSPHNGLAEYRNCQIRVASNPTHVTADQAFLPIVLGTSTGGVKASGSSSSRTPRLVAVGAIAVIAIVFAVARARRRPVAAR
jgi:hypothetical protein